MNILRVTQPPEAQPPTVKRKATPRLRVIHEQKDIRLTKHQLQAAVDAWIPSPGKHVQTCTNSSYVWIAISPTERHPPVLRYRVTRWTEVRRVNGIEMERSAIGNVMDVS
jgi:hypothetical protein